MQTLSNNLRSLQLTPLPKERPLLMIGHGTRDSDGRQTFLDFVKVYQDLDSSRPVIPCFLELTTPTIAEGVAYCVSQGYTEISALPILLFAARHNKFDVTNELDRTKQNYPQIKFHYGRHFGITPSILDLWRQRLAQLDEPEYNPYNISRSQTVLLLVGRGSSDPDANGDVYKLARILWEGSGYHTVETCFIGITHPRIEEGFRRARLYEPKRIIVVPYFLFTGALVKKIFAISQLQQEQHPEILINCLPEMGIQPQLLELVRQREIETQLGSVQMNCEMCKFRLAALSGNNGHSHDHHHHHHDHHHHDHSTPDPYANVEQYHDRIWKTP
ncbi:cobalamin (vitamin B12) biosynthesis CbiX protein [Gloeothece citriformis PCC 7424]|uniref:Cobalamin (Vitamin B12) biosynthesis CbiX protein n=1 Tax=Gloeothece citriformis (strain PCC 7424) TaxID=65393 RepID=B7KA86_GLOC7|nr:sirohydrochlorin chelatase [Gloeothece citriformis]ACK72860.1 cobalamin (vitamin B12) biosynthesis CbiX protein [Gloeothece citriformis PCC 7424]